MRRCLIAVLVVGAFLVTACGGVGGAQGVVAPKAAEPTPVFHGVWQDRPIMLPDLTLSDTSGQRFNLRKSPSRPVTLVSFAYADCHVCSGTLSGLAAALHSLPDGLRDDIAVLVIDIAPDSTSGHQSRWRAWLDGFDPEFVGLTGSAADVQGLADDLRVEIQTGDDGVPLHSDHIIGFDRKDVGVLLWTSVLPADAVADDLAQFVALQRSPRGQ